MVQWVKAKTIAPESKLHATLAMPGLPPLSNAVHRSMRTTSYLHFDLLLTCRIAGMVAFARDGQIASGSLRREAVMQVA